MDYVVETIVEFDGKLTVGGWFSYAGSRVVSSIAQWDGVKWAPMDAGLDSPVVSLLVYNTTLAFPSPKPTTMPGPGSAGDPASESSGMEPWVFAIIGAGSVIAVDVILVGGFLFYRKRRLSQKVYAAGSGSPYGQVNEPLIHS